jgi:hypothetical protein
MQRPLSPRNCFRAKRPSDDLFFYAAPGRVEIHFFAFANYLAQEVGEVLGAGNSSYQTGRHAGIR